MVFSGAGLKDSGIDPIVTGVVKREVEPLFESSEQRIRSGVLVRSPLRRRAVKPGSDELNPYPDDRQSKDMKMYRIMFATAGRALLSTEGDVIAVYPGARLPDGAIVRTVNRNEGLWQVEDSSGRVFR